MKKAIYKFHADCGRMGSLEGVFISTKSKVEKLIKSKVEVYFGEVLGKHSEIFGAIEKKDLTFVTDDAVVVELFEKHELSSGWNPFDQTSTNFNESWFEDDMTIDEIVEKLISQ